MLPEFSYNRNHQAFASRILDYCQEHSLIQNTASDRDKDSSMQDSILISSFHLHSPQSQSQSQSQTQQRSTMPTSTTNIQQPKSKLRLDLKQSNSISQKHAINPYSFTICQQHNKSYEFYCFGCQQLRCRKCSCQTRLYLKRSKHDGDLESSYNNEINHNIINLKHCLSILRDQADNNFNRQFQNQNLNGQYMKICEKIKQMQKNTEIVQKITADCIEMLIKNRQAYLKTMLNLRRNFEEMQMELLQARDQQIENQHIVQSILKKTEFISEDYQYRQRTPRKQQVGLQQSMREAIDMIIINWSVVQSRITSTNKSRKQENNHQNNKNRIPTMQKYYDIENSNSIIMGSLLKVKAELQGISTDLNRKRDLSHRAIDDIENVKANEQYPQQTTKLSRSVSIKMIPSRNSMEIFTSKKLNKPLVSLTNMINRQINKSTSNLKASPELQEIKIYGGTCEQPSITVYHPTKCHTNNRNSHSNTSIAQKQSKQQSYANSAIKFSQDSKITTRNYVGFGLVQFRTSSLINKSNQQNKDNVVDFITIGGYLNQEISDCVFRVSERNKKKELIGRLRQPLAYFGFDCIKTCNKGKIVYICGGENQPGRPVSTFFSYEFSELGAMLNLTTHSGLDEPRHSLSLTVYHSYLYAIGGMDCDQKTVKTVTRFNIAEQQWGRVGSLCYSRSKHAAVTLKSGLYAIGGWNEHNYLRSVERFNENKLIFQVVMDMQDQRCSFGVKARLETNEIIILGGRNQTQLSACQLLSIKTKKSNKLVSLPAPNSGFYCL